MSVPDAAAQRLASYQRYVRSGRRDQERGDGMADAETWLEELPYDEVADTLGCTETAARLRVMRALGKLARMLNVAGT